MYEEAFFHLLNALHERHRARRRSSIAGGCAQESVANGKVTPMTPFREVYVQAAAGDAGGAMGAALVACEHALQRGDSAAAHAWTTRTGGRMFDASCGRRAAATTYARSGWRSLRGTVARSSTFDDESELCRRTAAAIADGQVVGLVPGAHGVGPARARQPLASSATRAAPT